MDDSKLKILVPAYILLVASIATLAGEYLSKRLRMRKARIAAIVAASLSVVTIAVVLVGIPGWTQIKAVYPQILLCVGIAGWIGIVIHTRYKMRWIHEQLGIAMLNFAALAKDRDDNVKADLRGHIDAEIGRVERIIGQLSGAANNVLDETKDHFRSIDSKLSGVDQLSAAVAQLQVIVGTSRPKRD